MQEEWAVVVVVVEAVVAVAVQRIADARNDPTMATVRSK